MRLEDQHVGVELQEPVELIDPGDPGADDDELVVGHLRTHGQSLPDAW
jgi:hypothetical protein